MRTQVQVPPQDATRRCHKCHQRFPLDPDFFPRSRVSLHGLQYICRTCNADRCRLQRDARRGQGEIAHSRVCPSCRVQKGATAFYRNPSQPDGLHHSCKMCERDHRTVGAAQVFG